MELLDKFSTEESSNLQPVEDMSNSKKNNKEEESDNSFLSSTSKQPSRKRVSLDHAESHMNRPPQEHGGAKKEDFITKELLPDTQDSSKIGTSPSKIRRRGSRGAVSEKARLVAKSDLQMWSARALQAKNDPLDLRRVFIGVVEVAESEPREIEIDPTKQGNVKRLVYEVIARDSTGPITITAWGDKAVSLQSMVDKITTFNEEGKNAFLKNSVLQDRTNEIF